MNSPAIAARTTAAPSAASSPAPASQIPKASQASRSLSPSWSSPTKDGFSAAPAGASSASFSNGNVDSQRAASGVLMMQAAAVSGGQPLNDAQKQLLRNVFGCGLNVDALRVTTGSPQLFNSLPRETPAFTVGNTIVVNPKYTLDNSMLVHESTHAWQYQNGGADYLPKALMAQAIGQGYDWQKGLSSCRSFSELNPEQQAQFIENAYDAGYFTSGSFEWGGIDYTSNIDAAMKDVRVGKGVSTTWDTGW